MVSPMVARAIEGAAPKSPSKLLGRRTSPRAANRLTTTPPTTNRKMTVSIETKPLYGLSYLFFAVKGRNEDKDGELLIMDAPKLLPEQPRVPKGIVGMRHP